MEKEYNRKVKDIKGMGFTEEQAKNALLINKGDLNEAVNYLLTQGFSPINQGPKQKPPPKTSQGKRSGGGIFQNLMGQAGGGDAPDIADEEDEEEIQFKIAMNESLITTARKPAPQALNQSSANNGNRAEVENGGAWDSNNNFDFMAQFEPLNAADRQRNDREPVGLKNIGNTCYFNSLIQTYFYIPSFTTKILQAYSKPLSPKPLVKNNSSSSDDEMAMKRGHQAKLLLDNLAKLFVQMVMANRKYVDPTQVLKSLTDDFGNPVHIGEQKDLGEFNLNFLERIEEGLGEKASPIFSPPAEDKLLQNVEPELIQTSSSFDLFEAHSSANAQEKANVDVEMSEPVSLEKNNSSNMNEEEKVSPASLKPAMKIKSTDIVPQPGSSNGSQEKPKATSSTTKKKAESKNSSKTKESTDQSDSTMQKMFFGSKMEILKLLPLEEDQHMHDGAASPVSPLVTLSKQKAFLSSRKEKLGPIHLEIQNTHRLYESWDEAFQDEVRDFVPAQAKQRCFQESWILDRPQVLFFSLSRVHYNKETKRLVKCHDYFSFDKVIYADMFLYENQEKANQVREDIEVMKAKIKQLNAKLNDFQSYKNEFQISLVSQFQNIELYIKDQPSEEITDKVLNFLKQQKESAQKEVANLQNQLKKLTSQLDSAFIQQKKCPYYLHSIVVHDGMQAESGHYYSFIYDRAGKSWWRFNDFQASQETEDVVFEEAFGGKNLGKCAYSLIYANRSIAKQLDKMPFAAYSAHENQVSAVSSSLKSHVHEANLKFEKELIDYQVERIGKQIVDKLKQRTDQVKQCCEQMQGIVTPSLVNFGMFLKAVNRATLMRWALLNDCVREEHPAQLSLKNLTRDDAVFSGLCPRYFSKQFLILNDTDSKEIEQHLQNFKNYTKQCELTTFVLLNLNSEAWMKAIEVFLYFKQQREKTIQKQQQKGDLTQQNLAFDGCRIFMIESLLQASICLSQLNIEQALEKCNLAATITVLVLESTDSHHKQTIASIERLQSITKKRLAQLYSKDIEKRFNEILAKIKKGILTKEEKLGAALPEALELELSIYEQISFDNNLWTEGWKPECIAFRYYNVLQMFKTKYDVALKVHSHLLKNNQPYTNDQMSSVEQEHYGFDLNKLVKTSP